MIKKIIGFAVGALAFVSIISLIIFIFVIHAGFLLNLAFYSITGTFLGFEYIIVSWAETLSYWLFIIIFCLSMLVSFIYFFEKRLKAITSVLFIVLILLACLGAVNISNSLIDSSNLARKEIFNSIINTFIYFSFYSSSFEVLNSG